jgi:TP901 family phage tail tape measure protein
MASRFSVEAIFKAVDKITGPLTRMGSSVDKFSKGAKKKMEAISELDIGGGFAKLAAVSTAGAVAVGAGIREVVKSGMDFEQAITDVGAVSLMSRKEIADLEKKAIELGASTKFSATEVANAMEMMGKAGFTNSEILDGISGVLAAAAAEGAGLAETASTVSNVLKGMGLEAKDSSRVADVLTLASARTNSSITSLGESMKELGPVAKQFNIPLEQAVAMAALLQDVGLDASAAGTSAASALTKLAKPTKKAQVQMAKFGVSFKDANGNMKSAPEIFGEMAKAVKKSGGNMEQAAFFADLVGLESQKAAINLTNAFQSGKADDLIKELGQAKGKAEEMANLRMDTLGGDIEQLSGSVDSLKLKLYSTESGPLRDLVKQMDQFVKSNSDLVGTGVTKFFQDMQPVLDVLVQSFKTAWPPIQQAVQGFLGLGKDTNYLGAMQEFAVVLGKVAALAIGFGLAFAGTVVAGLQLAAGAITLLMNAGDWLLADLGRIVFLVDDWFGNLGAKWRKGALDAIGFLLKGLLDGILTGMGPVGKAIEGLGGFAISAFKRVLGIKSPSKVFAKLGAQTAAGFDQGLTSQMNRVNTRIEHAIAIPAINARSLGSDYGPSVQRPGAYASPQMVTPQARAANAIDESTSTVKTEVTIRDETGTAEVTKKPAAGGPVKIRVNQSGQM